MTRRGLTIIELLVSITLIAILVGLVLSGIQYVREQSRVTACRNNLRQIGVAISNYETLHRVFPATGSPGSFHVTLLPYLEQKPLYDQFLSDIKSGAPAIYDSFGEQHPAPTVYLCPSESAPHVVSHFNGHAYATSYAGNFGTGVQAYGYNGIIQRPASAGLFPKVFPQGYVRSADVRDGLSNTAAVSEILHADGTAHRQRTFWETPRQLARPDQLDAFAGVCRGIPPQPLDYGWRGDRQHLGSPWTKGDVAHTQYNHVLGPNSPSCTNGGLWQFSIVSANSLHASLVNVLYADGRVAGMADSVELRIWRDLGSRSDAVLIHP